jgi:hypothetical protein
MRRASPAFLAALLLSSAADVAAQDADIAAACESRKPCALARRHVAGSDDGGRALAVIELNLGTKNPDNASGDARFDCKPYRREFWLVGRGIKRSKILELCNDGYGASGVGEDKVAIGPNRLVHDQYGGSAWRWQSKQTVQLSPLREIARESCGYHTLSPGFTWGQWDWRRFGGIAKWKPHPCGEAKDDDTMGCEPEKAPRQSRLVPRFDAAFGKAAAVVHLGSCAAQLEESGKDGYVVFGAQPGRAGGAVVRYLMISPRDLVVSVTDDYFEHGAASWVDDDHIEIWLGPDRTGGAGCDRARQPMAQWGIGLATGALHHGAGSDKEKPEVVLRLARAIDGRRQVTLHIRLPWKEESGHALTIVYSKSAGGKQARLVATSPIRRTDPTTLSAIHKIADWSARCVLRNGQLDLVERGIIDPSMK